jgi:hypothetical protein
MLILRKSALPLCKYNKSKKHRECTRAQVDTQGPLTKSLRVMDEKYSTKNHTQALSNLELCKEKYSTMPQVQSREHRETPRGDGNELLYSIIKKDYPYHVKTYVERPKILEQKFSSMRMILPTRYEPLQIQGK